MSRAPTPPMRRRAALCLALCAIAVVLGGLVPTARAAGGAGGDGADYYALLGVRKSATVADIRKQYKALAKQWHPDKVQGDEAAKQAAQQKFMAINEAHEVLSDPESRREYDEDRAHPRGGQRGWNPRQQNPFHRYRHQQQYQNWQRAQYHWQQQHQYANTPPLLFSFLSTPLLLMIVVPMVYLLWSAVTAESGDDDDGAAQQQPPRQQGQPQAAPRKEEKKTKKVVLTPMQERALQLAPDLVQVEMGALGVIDLDRLDSHHVVVFLPSVAMLAKMAGAGAGVGRTAGRSSGQGGGGGGGGGGGDDEGTKLWRALRDVAATFTRSDRIVFAWTDKSAAAFRQAVQRVRPSFELHHPDPAVLVLKRQKLAGGSGASSSKPASSSSASAKLGGGGSAGGAGGAAAAPRRLEYAAAIAYVCPRHDRLSSKQFTAPAISAWVANQLCDGMARWKDLGAAPVVLQAR